LQTYGKLSDLVEEKRASVGQFDFAFLLRNFTRFRMGSK